MLLSFRIPRRLVSCRRNDCSFFFAFSEHKCAACCSTQRVVACVTVQSAISVGKVPFARFSSNCRLNSRACRRSFVPVYFSFQRPSLVFVSEGEDIIFAAI